MKPLEELAELRRIVADADDHLPARATDPAVVSRASRLIHALKESEHGARARNINPKTRQELSNLEWMLGSLFLVPTDGPSGESNPDKLRSAILGALATLEGYFSAATSPGR